MQQLEELYGRDKNRPSVVMWSVGNEPRSQKPQASSYFRSDHEIEYLCIIVQP